MAYEAKTKATENSVDAFLSDVEQDWKREQSYELIDLMRKVTGEEPKLWGPSIVGFGKYHYVYDSGHEGDAMVTGFSPRKREFSIYLATEFQGKDELLDKLGKHRVGKSCLYVKNLDDVDRDVLRTMVEKSVQHVRNTWPVES